MREFSPALQIELESFTDPRTYAEVVMCKLRDRHAEEPFTRWAGTSVEGVNYEKNKPTDNPFWDIIRLGKTDDWLALAYEKSVDWLEDIQLLDRKKLAMMYAWSIPSPMDLDWMQAILDGRHVVEMGAGSGYWAWQLSQLGTNVIAYDNGEWEWQHRWHHVNYGEPDQVARHSDRALLLVWPPYASSMAAETLRAYTGDLVFYAGEGAGGCTGDDEFHDMLDTEWQLIGYSSWHITFGGIHCSLSAYRRLA